MGVSKKIRYCYLTAFIVLIADRLTKFAALKLLPSAGHPLIGDIIGLKLVRNTGAGFGVLKGYVWLFSIISFGVISLIVWYIPQMQPRRYAAISFGLLLGGAIGNLIDRIAYGCVIDFIDIWIWPTFNIADIMISASAVGIIIYFLREKDA